MAKTPNIIQGTNDNMFVQQAPGDHSGKGPTILYIHGLGDSGLSYGHLLAHKKLHSIHQILPDLPGFGRSKWRSSGPLKLDEHVENLAKFISTLNCVAVNILGHSMGGVIGLLLAERHPELVRSFLNVEGNICLHDCTFSRRATEHGKDHFISQGFDDLKEAIYRVGRNDLSLRAYHAGLLLADPSAYYNNSVELIKFSEKPDIAQRMANLPLPVHFIAGLPEGISKKSQDLLSSSAVPWTGIKPAGHVPFFDQTERFVDLLLEFLPPVS